MELLVIKSGNDYIRLKDGRATTAGLDKASVFPAAQLDQVKAQLADLRQNDFPDAAIYRLMLTETPL